jgi:hypothetical protein
MRMIAIPLQSRHNGPKRSIGVMKGGIMRNRLMLVVAGFVAVLLISGGVIRWQSSVTAQDDAVPVLQTQVADLQTRVTALESATLASDNVVSFEGHGTSTTDSYHLERGVYTVAFFCGTVNGGSVSFYNSDDDFNRVESRLTPGSALVPFERGDFIALVECPGTWTLTLTPKYILK